MAGRLIVVGRGAPLPKARAAEAVEHPGKLLRLATMIRSVLEEMRGIPLDEGSRSRLREVFDHTVAQLEGLVSKDLREELEALAPPIEGLPSESEIRVAQAQLMGWLEGLLHGIEAAVWAQFVASQAQLEEVRRRALQAREEQEQEADRGRYL
ncbi:MAG TPA: proteasome activator [Actinomycetota bacterium]